MHYLGDPSALFKEKSADIIAAVSANLLGVVNELYSRKLISKQTKEEMLTLGTDNYSKASKLVHDVEGLLGISSDSDSRQFLIDFCQVLIMQQQTTLTELSVSILEKLGKYNSAILFSPFLLLIVLYNSNNNYYTMGVCLLP